MGDQADDRDENHVREALRRIEGMLGTVLERLESIMSEQANIDAATAAIADADQKIQGLLTDVDAKLQVVIQAVTAAKTSGDFTALDEAVGTLAQTVTQAQQVDTDAATAATDATPPAPPTPSPTPAASVVTDPASGLPLYVFSGTDPVDITKWTAVSDVTGPNGQVLYTFDGDTAGQPPTGVDATAGWALFTGTTTPVTAGS